MRLPGTCTLLLLLGMMLRAAPAQTAPASASMSMPMDMPMPASPAAASATSPAPPDLRVAISSVDQDGKQIVATVTQKGAPVKGLKVVFSVTRAFGRLEVGHDETDEDGVAMSPFPSTLPGDLKGNLEFNAMVQGPLSKWGAEATAILPGGTPRQPPADSFPRALWSPSAPLGLIAAIAVLVGGAWGAYLFVAYQLLAIRRGASR